MFFNSSDSRADTKDCSKYSTKNAVGLYNKLRCEKGKNPRKKLIDLKELDLGNKLKKLNPFKKKN